IEGPTIHQQAPRRAKIAAHGDTALPRGDRRPARPEAGRGNGACHAEQVELRPDAGTQRLADMRSWKHRPLYHANITAEWRQANRQRGAGGAGTNDADVDALGGPDRDRHAGCTLATSLPSPAWGEGNGRGSNQSGRWLESRR